MQRPKLPCESFMGLPDSPHEPAWPGIPALRPAGGVRARRALAAARWQGGVPSTGCGFERGVAGNSGAGPAMLGRCGESGGASDMAGIAAVSGKGLCPLTPGLPSMPGPARKESAVPNPPHPKAAPRTRAFLPRCKGEKQTSRAESAEPRPPQARADPCTRLFLPLCNGLTRRSIRSQEEIIRHDHGPARPKSDT